MDKTTILKFFKILFFSIFALGIILVMEQGVPQEKAFAQIRSTDIKIIGEYAPGELLVKFKPGIPGSKIEEIKKGLGVSVHKRIPRIDVRVMRIPEGKEVAEMIEAFRKFPEVEYAEPNYRCYKTVTIPDDTYFSQQWALSLIEAPSGWDITTGSSSIIIAVIDDGIDPDHQEFPSEKLWINSSTGQPGYDFAGTCNVCRELKEDIGCTPDDDVTHESGSGHGTATAGIAAAATDNAEGIAGTSWGPTIMPLKVENSCGHIYHSYMAEAVGFAVDNGAHIISMSLGGPSPSATLENACRDAWENGKVIVVSSGNENTNISYPARFLTNIAVGATNEIDNRIYPGNPGNNWSSGGSNYGPELDVVAPGINIYATDWSASGEGYDPGADYISYFGGTSASCPFVSGVAALLLSLDPDLPNERVRSIIRNTAEDEVGEPAEDTPGFDIYYGYGRINLYQALLAETRPDLTLTVADISFSNNNPFLGENITIYATIHNDGSVYDEIYINPFASVPQHSGSGFYVDSNFSIAQSFTATVDGYLAAVDLSMLDIGSDSTSVQIEIQTDSGINTPSGTIISSTEIQDWPADQVTWERIEFYNPAKLIAWEKYWIVATCSDSYQNGYLWGFNDGAVYADGGTSIRDNSVPVPSWGPESAIDDCQFKTYIYAHDTVIRFYDGDPDSGGTLIESEQYLSPIGAFGDKTASVGWTAAGSGSHNIWVVADPDDYIPESNEANNNDFESITVMTELSVSVSPDHWSLEIVEAGSVTTMTLSEKIIVENTGTDPATFTIQITDSGGSWFAATTENGNTLLNTYVMSGVFASLSDTTIGEEHFNEGTDDDVIISANPKTASTTIFCSSSSTADGVNVPASGQRALWLQFKSPPSTTTYVQQAIDITVGAQASP